ncbi:hypothetical protein [Salinispora sp. H7-4]|uniref:hypothetical protein n=1 Tax=Salinispora sp. H7-4 TaxID=2748321 RepID=UPI00210249DB|nr:hypothetical protein [Salinispora sp. H7-4]
MTQVDQDRRADPGGGENSRGKQAVPRGGVETGCAGQAGAEQQFGLDEEVEQRGGGGRGG